MTVLAQLLCVRRGIGGNTLWSVRPAILRENPAYFDRIYRLDRYIGRSLNPNRDRIYCLDLPPSAVHEKFDARDKTRII